MDWPLTRICPALGTSKPAMRFKSVDLPQPLAPTNVTICFSWTASVMSSSAVTKESPVSNRLVTEVMLMLPTEGLSFVPGEQHVTSEQDQPVAQESQQADAQHRRYHNVVAIEQVGV